MFELKKCSYNVLVVLNLVSVWTEKMFVQCISCVESSYCAVVYEVPQRRSANLCQTSYDTQARLQDRTNVSVSCMTRVLTHKRQISSTVVNKQHFARQNCLTLSFIIIPRFTGGGYTVFTLSVHPSVPRYFSSHLSRQLLMAEIWYLVSSFI